MSGSSYFSSFQFFFFFITEIPLLVVVFVGSHLAKLVNFRKSSFAQLSGGGQ